MQKKISIFYRKIGPKNSFAFEGPWNPVDMNFNKILHLHDAKRYDLKKISKGLFISLLYKLNELNSNFHSEFVCLVSILKLNLKTVDYRFNFFSVKS